MKNPKIVTKSIEIARAMFPGAYARKEGYKPFHFAFAWKRGHMLAIGQNHTYNPKAVAYRYAKRFGDLDKIKYPYLHAEIDMIDKLWGRLIINRVIKVVSLRINSLGELQNAKPCSSCAKVLSQLQINRIWYSNEDGNVVAYVS